MVKKVLGIIFITIGSVLGLSVFFQLKESDYLVNIYYYFTGRIDDAMFGEAVGRLFANIIIILLVIILFRIGLKWIRNKT